MHNILSINIGIIILCSFVLIHSQALDNIESIEYDSTQSRYLISNSNSILALDSTGTLTFFGEGAVAEYGMEIMDGMLFAIADNAVGVYSVDNESELDNIAVPGAGFLNGITHDDNHNIYVTDFSGGKVIKINMTDPENPEVSTLAENISSQPNGIVYDPVNNWVIFVNWVSNMDIMAIDLATEELITIASTSLGRCDGITRDPEGNYYVACWSPQSLTKFDDQFTQPGTTIDTDPEVNNPADITFNPDKYEVAIPNSGNETLTFAQFEKPVVAIDNNQAKTRGILTAGKNSVSWTQTAESHVNLTLYDVSGSPVQTLADDYFGQGRQVISLQTNLHAPGMYLLKMTRAAKTETLKVVLD